MAFVLLPCDLPGWADIEEILKPLKGEQPPQLGARATPITPTQLCSALQGLHTLCNVSIDPGGGEPVPADYFQALDQLLQKNADLLQVVQVAVPKLVHAALQLGVLKPPEGLSYSLQQQSDALVLPRAMVSSLVAHTFLSTLPRRSVMSHPTLCNPVMAAVIHEIASVEELVKVRAVLQYFALLDCADNTQGNVIIDRKVMGADSFLRLRKWRECRQRLCRLQVTTEPLSRLPSKPCILACSCTAHPARAALLPHCIQDARGLEPHPELLVMGLLAEKLEDNEAIQVTGVLSPSPPQGFSPDDLTYALLDPDDYGDSYILQYESINILRELNKCFLAFSPPITLTKDRVIPGLPAGIVLQRPLYASAVSAASPESSLPSTPAAKGGIDKHFEYPEVAKESRNRSVHGKEMIRTSTEKSTLSSNDSQASQEGNTQNSDITKTRFAKSPVSPNASTTKESSENTKLNSIEIVAELNTKQNKITSETGDDRSKPSAPTVESEKKKMPKFLELFLPKKILAPIKKTIAVFDSKNGRSSGLGSESSDITNILTENEFKNESGFEEGNSNDTTMYVAAPSTLRKKNKNNFNDITGDNGAANTAVVKSNNRVQSPKTVSFDKDTSSGLPNESTSDLLNRVLKVIQKLEKEQSILLKNIPANEIIEEDLIPKTDDLNTKSLHKLKNKPPLPECSKKAGRTKKPHRPKSVHLDHAHRDEGQRNKVGVSSDGRKLSVYQSCSEEEYHTHEDDQFFSASESLDMAEETPRRKGGHRDRLPNCRRKHSFAERLQEAMERGGSTDRSSQHSDNSAHHNRRDSRGFVLGSHEDSSLEGERITEESKSNLRRESTIKAASSKFSNNKSLANDNEANKEDRHENTEIQEEEGGSGSSRYSFSSDYTSELEEIYDHLEEVLYQLEGASPGPRTAAIAQLAHKLLKRAFSESSKGQSVAADGSFAEGSPERADTRARSMSEGELQGSKGEEGDATGNTTEDMELPTTDGVTILTESWGCDELGGDRQLKALLQWAAASMAGAERVVYCTHGQDTLVKLCLVGVLLTDRRWTVGQLIDAILGYCNLTLNKWRNKMAAGKSDQDKNNTCIGATLFDQILHPPAAN